MKYNRLGTSELLVSEIAFGTWRTFGKGISKERAVACIRAALDNHINLIDTANVYGLGEAEAIIGEALTGTVRDSYILSTKIFFPMTDRDYGLSKTQIFKQAELSLKRLRTDHIDLYQCHRYDPDIPLEETLLAMTRLVEQGKVRYIGFSEWPCDKITAALDIPGVERFVSNQPQYSMLWRKPEKDVFPVCERNNISQIVWAPLAEGVLTGKYLANASLPENSRASHSYMGKQFPRNLLIPSILNAVQEVAQLAESCGTTLSQFALRWVLQKSIVASAIIGATSPEQIIENVGATDKAIDPAYFRKADSIFQSVDAQYESS